MGPSPDGSNDHNHASIKTVIKLGVRVWEEQGIESAEKMYSAEDVTEEGQRQVSFHQNIHLFWLEGNGWKWGAGQQMPSNTWILVYLDSLLITLMRAPFSSFSLWLSDFSSVNTCRWQSKKCVRTWHNCLLYPPWPGKAGRGAGPSEKVHVTSCHHPFSQE